MKTEKEIIFNLENYTAYIKLIAHLIIFLTQTLSVKLQIF